MSERCGYVTAANMQCLLAVDEDHSTGHDILGDLHLLHLDPLWGVVRAQVWVQVEKSRLTGLLYKRCTCGHTRGAHTKGPREPGGPCCRPSCSCATYESAESGEGESQASHSAWDGWFCLVCGWEENPL